MEEDKKQTKHFIVDTYNYKVYVNGNGKWTNILHMVQQL